MQPTFFFFIDAQQLVNVNHPLDDFDVFFLNKWKGWLVYHSFYKECPASSLHRVIWST